MQFVEAPVDLCLCGLDERESVGVRGSLWIKWQGRSLERELILMMS